MQQTILKNLGQFELLTESSNGILVSGFSTAIQSNIIGGLVDRTNKGCTINNCNGGNCAVGCSPQI